MERGDTDTDLARAIRETRTTLGLSQAAAAREAEVNRGTWKGWELGTRRPYDYNHPTIERTLRWPKGTVDALIAGPQGPPSHPPEPVATSRTDPLAEVIAASAEELDRMQSLIEKYKPGEGAQFRRWADDVRAAHAKGLRNGATGSTELDAG